MSSGEDLVKVYRVEHAETRTGPYNTWGTTIEDMVQDHANSLSEHPGPCDDGLEDVDSFVHFFGFEKPEHLTDWFEEKYLKILHQEGFVRSTYAVKKRYVLFGGRQLVFEKDYAELVKEEPLVISHENGRTDVHVRTHSPAAHPSSAGVHC